MKLFTPKEMKSRTQVELAVIRSEEEKARKALTEKLDAMNSFNAEHGEKMKEKQKELADIEFKVRCATFDLQKNVEALEERRRQALMPITEETKKLEDLKEAVSTYIRELDDKREELNRERQVVRQEQTALEVASNKFTNTQLEAAVFIERQKQEAQNVITSSEAAIKRLQESEKSHAEYIKTLEAKEASVAKAEMMARAAIVAADERIAREKVEQEKTDEKRRMLRTAIDQLKKKGLWAMASGIQTK